MVDDFKSPESAHGLLVGEIKAAFSSMLGLSL